MTQSKKHTHYEVLVNQVLGITYGWLVVFLIFPYMKHMPPAEMASYSSVIFFIGSYGRAYGVRRYYEKIRLKELNEQDNL